MRNEQKAEENIEKTTKTSRYAPKVYSKWGGKRGKSKYSEYAVQTRH
jgi:hypothetical protein